MTTALESVLLTGTMLRGALIVAADHMRENAAAVDAINEYPVPDGDTGSNMSATVDRAMEQVAALDEGATVAEVLQALARGSLYGARGNSGVILSQAFRGLAAGVGVTAETLDAAQLAEGMKAAAEAAYRAVSKPAEGTMLTVLRRAGEAAQDAASGLTNGGVGSPCFPVLRSAIAEAEAAESETMQMLPELMAAGVPDAGGEGVCVILRGLMAAVTGERPVSHALPVRRETGARLDDHPAYGFCTEFLIEEDGTRLDVEAVRALILPGNSSVVVVGDETLVRVHVHSLEPETVLEQVREMGRVSRVKIEDMSAQNVRLRETGSGAGMKTALLAMSHGAGFDELFRGLGAEVAPLGEIVKPSAGEIAAAADALHVADVVFLPNHKNVLLAAQQAVSLATCTIHVVPAATLAQGIAASVHFDAKALPAKNVAEMSGSFVGVRTVEVTVALSDRVADGIVVKAGQAIALLDGTLVAATSSPFEALEAGLRAADVEEAELVTVYRGEGADADEGQLLAMLGVVAADAEGEVLEGGQPLYHYIAAVE